MCIYNIIINFNIILSFENLLGYLLNIIGIFFYYYVFIWINCVWEFEK